MMIKLNGELSICFAVNKICCKKLTAKRIHYSPLFLK